MLIQITFLVKLRKQNRNYFSILSCNNQTVINYKEEEEIIQQFHNVILSRFSFQSKHWFSFPDLLALTRICTFPDLPARGPFHLCKMISFFLNEIAFIIIIIEISKFPRESQSGSSFTKDGHLCHQNSQPHHQNSKSCNYLFYNYAMHL